MGKGAISEKSPLFSGVYCGAASMKDDIVTAVESSDCVLWIGRYAVSNHRNLDEHCAGGGVYKQTFANSTG